MSTLLRVASRKEQKEALRAQRLERERAQSGTRRKRRLFGYGAAGGIALLALLALGAFLVLGVGGGDDETADGWPEGTVPAQQQTDLRAAVQAANCELENHDSEGNQHLTTDVEYESNPPHSGDHNPIPHPDGASLRPPRLEDAVHSLEHGRIYVQFNPSVSNDVKGQLKALFDEDPYHMILTPNGTRMPYQVAATTWRNTLTCEQMSPQAIDAIRLFRERYRDRGPEYVP